MAGVPTTNLCIFYFDELRSILLSLSTPFSFLLVNGTLLAQYTIYMKIESGAPEPAILL